MIMLDWEKYHAGVVMDGKMLRMVLVANAHVGRFDKTGTPVGTSRVRRCH